jgi:hypothetical protein
MSPLQRILEKLPSALRTGTSYQALCPAHDDHDPSLNLRQTDDHITLITSPIGVAGALP